MNKVFLLLGHVSQLALESICLYPTHLQKCQEIFQQTDTPFRASVQTIVRLTMVYRTERFVYSKMQVCSEARVVLPL